VSTNDFDLSKLALSPGLAMPIKERLVRPTQRRRAHFIRKPYPWWEKLAIARADGPTMLWADHILYEHWRRKGEPFTLRNGAVPGCTPKQKQRALAKLEALGLIEIERRPRKAPILKAVHLCVSHVADS
jgi:hypothetical protein